MCLGQGESGAELNKDVHHLVLSIDLEIVPVVA